DKLVEDLNLTRDISRNPLFDIIINYFNLGQQEADIKLDPNAILDLGGMKIQHDLEFIFEERLNGIKFTICFLSRSITISLSLWRSTIFWIFSFSGCLRFSGVGGRIKKI
ncbi:MAG: hypothetical protein AAF639_03630, partial [Chloroflexota bacterium]